MLSSIWFLGAVHAASLSGQVRDRLSGEPISGVIVVAYDPRLNYAYAASTNSGDYSIVDIPAGTYRLRAWPSDSEPHVQRYWPNAWSFCDAEPIAVGEDEARADLDFELDIGGQLSGRLLDPDGAPVAGASVSCGGVNSRVAGYSRGATTDSDGRFTVVGLDGDAGATDTWALQLEAQGFPRQYPGPTYDDDESEPFEVRFGELTDAGDLSLLAGIAVTGTMQSPDGPLSGAQVHVYSSGQVLNTLSTEDGSYAVDGLPPGDVLVWGSLPGYGMTYYPDADRPGDRIEAPDEGMLLEGADLFLPVQSTFSAQFTGPDDASGVTVLVYNDAYTVGIGAQADASGLFTVDRLHGGDYRLFVYAEPEGYLNDFVRGEDGEPLLYSVPPQTEADFGPVTLPAAAMLVGEVVDDAGDPVYGATLYAIPTDNTIDTQADPSDRDGAFVVDGMSAATYTIEVLYDAYCPSDRGYVTVFWPNEVNPERAELVPLAAGEILDGLQFVMPIDDDHDQMADRWEDENGLDSQRDDADEDPDGDGYTNLEEYRLGSDPTLNPEEEIGCSGCQRSSKAVFLPLLFALRRRKR